jgi:uncharacterized protein (DUF488 family)
MHNLYTIGHSTNITEAFIDLLRPHGISAVADVRSAPYSRFTPQFNRELLQQNLRQADIEYVFLGDLLGARPRDSGCYVDGKVQFDRVARSEPFSRGLERLRMGMDSYRVALMCAERDPIGCHRMILVCRALRNEMRIGHIREGGHLEEHEDAERRLMQQVGVPETDLFASFDELLSKAYDIQGRKIAYTEKSDE